MNPQSTTQDATLDEHTQVFIATPEGFYARYVYNIAFFESNKTAYDETERQYSFIVGRRKYKNYDTFKAAYCRHCCQHKKNAPPVKTHYEGDLYES